MCHNLYVHTIDWDIHVDIENTTRRVSVDNKLTRLRERLLERFDMRSRSLIHIKGREPGILFISLPIGLLFELAISSTQRHRHH